MNPKFKSTIAAVAPASPCSRVTTAVALFGAGTALALSAITAHATAFVVTTTADEPFAGTETVAAPDGAGLSLREAIGLANQNAGAPEGEIDGDSITISPLIVALPPTITIGGSMTITDDVLIDGSLASPLNYTIDAAGSDRIFIVDTALAPGLNSTAILTQINLTRGATPGDGGGIEVRAGGSLALRAGTIISECRAGNGGGVHNSGRTSVDETQINRCGAGAAAGSGGGIFNAAGASLAITNSSFEGNIANRAGGAIEDQAGVGVMTVIETTTFTDNNAGVAPAAPAPGNGGAIHITGASDMTLNTCTATQNRAAKEGGAYWNGTGVMIIGRGQITQNRASGAAADDGGGGIFNNGGKLTVSDTLISGNVADGTAGSGGGVFSTTGDLIFSGDTVISANVANRAGGGIEAIEGTILLDGIVLGGANDAAGNIAGPAATAMPGNGGGLHVSNKCDVTVNGGRVAFNVAAREGGGLWNQVDATMTVQNGATISNNSATGPAADDGGGGIFNNGGTVILDGTDNTVTVTENRATGAAGSGGGILTAGGVLDVRESTITRNVANRAGGGIEGRDLTALTAISISRSTLSENNAGVAPAATASPGNGGGLHITGGVGGIVVTGSEVTENIAASEGGGLWNGTGPMLVEESGIAGNVASGADAINGGGGIFNAGGSVTITGGTINENIADGTAGSGGGIFVDAGGTIEVTNTILLGNLANRAGGGIEDNSGAGLGVTLTNVTLTENNAGVAPAVAAPGNGGGVHISGPGDINITGGSASLNVAAQEGGAYWNGAGTMTIDAGTIDGNNGAGPAAHDGGGGIFNNGGSVVVQNGTMISNNTATGAAGSGGGILNLGTLSLSGVTLESNIANRAGGGLEDASGAATSVTVTDTNFISNNVGVAPAVAAPGNGGGIHVGGDGSIEIAGGIARGNLAAAEGGAFWIGVGTMKITNTSATDNIASGAASDDGGGACFVAGGTLDITNGAFSNNIADGAAGSGGAILNDAGGSLTVRNSTFASNVANRAGGAIEDNSGAGLGVTLDEVTFTRNNAGVAPAVAAPGNGGAIHISGSGDINIGGGTATENVAASEGGAFWNGTGTMTITSAQIESNIASGNDPTNGGGGVFNNGGSLVIAECGIRSNVADGTSGSGGGIFNETDGKVSVSGSTLGNNIANRAGGGIEDNAGASIELVLSDLRGNVAGPAGTAAPGNGGAFHVTGAGTISFMACDIDGNQAANEGGGVWNSGAATMTVRDCLVQANRAPDGAGVFQQAGGGVLMMANVTISGNEGTNGGGLQTEGGTTDLLNVTIANNTASTGGGVNVMAGALNLGNTAIGDNTAATGTDLNGAIATASNSLLENVGGATGITDGVSGNIVGADPQLGALADNGGPSDTHLPAVSSPLVNAGSNALAGALANDQRGSGFPRVLGGIVDIGAVEVFVLTYAIWAEETFTDATPLDQRDPDDNPDCDARSNAMEFLTGTDPENGTDGSPLQIDNSTGDLVVIYDRVKAIPPGIDALEDSTDLDTWNTSVGVTRTATIQSPTLDQISLSLPSGGDVRLFGRLSLTGL